MNSNKEMKQAILFFAICAVGAMIGYYFVHQTQLELDGVEAEIATVEASIADLKVKVAKREELESRLRNIRESLSQFITILPSAEVATEERLYELIAEKTKRAQFMIDDIQIVQREGRAGAKKKGAAFKELSVKVQAEATYEQFLKFLNSLEAHETFLAVKDFTVTPTTTEDLPENAPLPLKISLSVSTYRYEPGGD
ncbi:MAG: type 4a pilus biogenesis protein PilO [Planctomycetota bacterium]